MTAIQVMVNIIALDPSYLRERKWAFHLRLSSAQEAAAKMFKPLPKTIPSNSPRFKPWAIKHNVSMNRFNGLIFHQTQKRIIEIDFLYPVI